MVGQKRTSCIRRKTDIERYRALIEAWIKKIIHVFYGDIRKNVFYVAMCFGIAFYESVCYNN